MKGFIVFVLGVLLIFAGCASEQPAASGDAAEKPSPTPAQQKVVEPKTVVSTSAKANVEAGLKELDEILADNFNESFEDFEKLETAQNRFNANASAKKPVKEFNVTIFHLGYAPKSFEVGKGDVVRFNAVLEPGTSTHKHGITIDEYGINVLVDSEDKNNPQVIEFAADQVGTFKIYCKTCEEGIFGKGHPPISAELIVK